NRGREERRSNARAARAAGHRATSPAEHPAKPGRAPATGPLGRFHGLAHPSLWSAVLALVLYLPALGDGFVWDDHWLIEANPALRGGDGLLRALVSDFWAPTGSASGYWRPLVVLSYGLDGALSHWNAAWFHAVNLLAHAGTSAAVAALATASGAGTLGSLAAGAWFAASPTHVESVAWIAGRTDVQCALLFLLALALDRRGRAAGRSRPGAGSLGLFGAALLAKETALVFLPVVALAEA